MTNVLGHAQVRCVHVYVHASMYAQHASAYACLQRSMCAFSALFTNHF